MSKRTPKTGPALVKEVRRVLKLSQHALATKIGRCPATIYRWETGRTEPPLSDARQLERMLARARASA